MVALLLVKSDILDVEAKMEQELLSDEGIVEEVSRVPTLEMVEAGDRLGGV
jgi:hypothetical protein